MPSSAWLEHLVYTEGVVGSNPTARTIQSLFTLIDRFYLIFYSNFAKFRVAFSQQNQPKEEKMSKCELEGCDDPHEARGLCKRHYQQWLRAGKPDMEEWKENR